MSPYKHLLLVALMSFFTASASAAVVFGDDVKFTYDDSTLYGTVNPATLKVLSVVQGKIPQDVVPLVSCNRPLAVTEAPAPSRK